MKRPGLKEIDWQRVAALTLKAYSSFFGFGSIGLLTAEITKAALQLSQSRNTLSDKVEQTTTALRDASMLVSELETKLTSQLKKVEELKADYEKYAQPLETKSSLECQSTERVQAAVVMLSVGKRMS